MSIYAMDELSNNEAVVEGKWIAKDGVVIGDQTCKRIEWLVSEKLRKVSTDASGWDRLYQDPRDNRYWVLSYSQSEHHGGGPPKLNTISLEEAGTKFDLKKYS